MGRFEIFRGNDYFRRKKLDVQVKITGASKFTMGQGIEKLMAFTSNILVCILIWQNGIPKRK